jgi:hypothetical protein
MAPEIPQRKSWHSTRACEGLPGVYSTIWCLCYKTNKLKKRKDRKRGAGPVYIGWRKGVAFVAGGGVERGWAGVSRSTRRDITWPKVSTRCTIQAVLRVFCC